MVREATRLFAEHGYSATSVGQIQQAPGLTSAIELHIDEYGRSKVALPTGCSG